MLKELLRGLLAEGWADSPTAIPEDAASQRHLLRTLMNIRPPLPAPPGLLALQDRFLAAERASAAVTDPHRLPAIGDVFGDGAIPFRDHLVLWKGDITTLTADAIVNAANSKLLGCFVPHHRCIAEAWRCWYAAGALAGLLFVALPSSGAPAPQQSLPSTPPPRCHLTQAPLLPDDAGLFGKQYDPCPFG